MEVVAEANKLCPSVDVKTDEDYPEQIITPEISPSCSSFLFYLYLYFIEGS